MIIYVHCSEETNISDPCTYELVVEIRPWKFKLVRNLNHDLTSAIPVQRFTHWANMPICELRWRNEDRLYSFLHHSAHIWSHIFTVIIQHVDQLPIGLLAQLVERCTGIAEVMGSNPVRTWIFSGLISSTSSVVFIPARIAYIRLLIITMWDSRKEGQGRKKAEFTRIPTDECFSLQLMLDRSEFKLPV